MLTSSIMTMRNRRRRSPIGTSALTSAEKGTGITRRIHLLPRKATSHRSSRWAKPIGLSLCGGDRGRDRSSRSISTAVRCRPPCAFRLITSATCPESGMALNLAIDHVVNLAFPQGTARVPGHDRRSEQLVCRHAGNRGNNDHGAPGWRWVENQPRGMDRNTFEYEQPALPGVPLDVLCRGGHRFFGPVRQTGGVADEIHHHAANRRAGPI